MPRLPMNVAKSLGLLPLKNCSQNPLRCRPTSSPESTSKRESLSGTGDFDRRELYEKWRCPPKADGRTDARAAALSEGRTDRGTEERPSPRGSGQGREKRERGRRRTGNGEAEDRSKSRPDCVQSTLTAVTATLDFAWKGITT